MWGRVSRQPARLLAALQQARLASGPPLSRDPRFASVQDADLAFFESVLGPGGVVTDPHELQPFNKSVLRALAGDLALSACPLDCAQIHPGVVRHEGS